MGYREHYPIARAIIVGAWVLALVPVAYDLGKLGVTELADRHAERERVDQERKDREARDRAQAAAQRAGTAALRRLQPESRLLPTERCVGGTVVTQYIGADGSKTNVQDIEHGRPVPCAGDSRLTPRE